MQRPGEEDWRWIDEHVEHPVPEVAGDEVRVVGREESPSPGPDAADREGTEDGSARTDRDRPADADGGR
ncbi:hypothetical protein [Geodermatophilus marinus]|uniref:hypothetical protein n=1 Tax=Geodermatophilus sp. LHW52908 TaxID=2303986 RepID=UPI000E3CE47C|nr:hypothetical protein [Geodermatophilus sp. LHW52908]RFU21932.1 hypothetical protein D0Z06_07285 [Geodermatophilus sp. LHW52908]